MEETLTVNNISFEGGFTVLMSVYRRDSPSLFRRAITSIYANTLLPNFVQIVVDGPVSQSINSILEEFSDQPEFRILRLAKQSGLSTALNAGLATVETAWVARADADDLNLPHRFAAQAISVACDKRIGLVGGAILEIDFNGSPIATRSVPICHEQILQYSKWRSPFNHMTVSYRVSAVRKVGGYPPIHLKEDYGLWAVLLSDGIYSANIDDILVHATAGPEMYRRRGGWKSAVAELALQRHLVRCHTKTIPSALVHGLARASALLMPARVRGILYKSLLRGNVSDVALP